MTLENLSSKIGQVRKEAGKALVGQSKMLDLLITSLLANGHVLIEGVPGVAKTLTARILSKMVKATFKRIQFTPDLMPSDILGTSVFNLKTRDFEYKKGPIFGDIVLIDEVNRAPAKTQSSLFEVMEERQITNDGTTYQLGGFFMVIATQNPIEQEGTYKLPEAQLDRFLFKIAAEYPTDEDEVRILSLNNEKPSFKSLDFINHILTVEDILAARELTGGILIKKTLLKYISLLVQATRSNPSLYLGASPRAAIDLMNASKAYAALNGRDFATPEDIQFLFRPVIEHRVIAAPEAELQGITMEEISRQIIQQVEVPK